MNTVCFSARLRALPLKGPYLKALVSLRHAVTHPSTGMQEEKKYSKQNLTPESALAVLYSHNRTLTAESMTRQQCRDEASRVIQLLPSRQASR